MLNTAITQDTAAETGTKYGHSATTKAFRFAYGRLNAAEQRKEQRLFCMTYDTTPGSFRARLAGTARVSDTEVAYLENRVATYFPKEGTITTH